MILVISVGVCVVILMVENLYTYRRNEVAKWNKGKEEERRRQETDLERRNSREQGISLADVE